MDRNLKPDKPAPKAPRDRSSSSLTLDFSFGQDTPRDVSSRDAALPLLNHAAKAVRTVALLQFYGAIAQVFGGVYVILSEESDLEPFIAALFTFTTTLSLASSVMLVVASFRMKALRSYRFVMLSMFAAALGGMSACPIATIALFSPIILILRPDIRRQFDDNSPG